MPYGTAGDDQPHYGAMTLHGVPKPVWRAFQLLHSHAGTHSVNTTAVTHGPLANLIAAHATVNATTASGAVDSKTLESGSGRLFLSHWDATGAAVNHSTVAVTISLRCDTDSATTCAAAAAGTSTLLTIDATTEAKTLWLSMGQPAVPSASQLEALKAHSKLKPAQLSWSKQTGDEEGGGMFTAVVSMAPNSACVVTL